MADVFSIGGLIGNIGGSGSLNVAGGNKTTINGKTYLGHVSIDNGRVFVDGKPVEGGGIDDDAREIVVTVEGSCDKIDLTSGKVFVEGDVGRVSTTTGDVRVKGSVGGGVNTMSGDVVVSGDANGRVSSMSGDISVGSRGRR